MFIYMLAIQVQNPYGMPSGGKVMTRLKVPGMNLWLSVAESVVMRSLLHRLAFEVF